VKTKPRFFNVRYWVSDKNFFKRGGLEAVREVLGPTLFAHIILFAGNFGYGSILHTALVALQDFDKEFLVFIELK